MANTQYPADLPTGALWGWSQIPGDNVVRSSTSSGRTLARQRFTVAVQRFQVSTILTGEQYQSFLDFWNDGINGGASVFDWKHPHTREAATFLPLGPFNHSHLGGGDRQKHRVSMILELVG